TPKSQFPERLETPLMSTHGKALQHVGGGVTHGFWVCWLCWSMRNAKVKLCDPLSGMISCSGSEGSTLNWMLIPAVPGPTRAYGRMTSSESNVSISVPVVGVPE